jgi:hypothetical protein
MITFHPMTMEELFALELPNLEYVVDGMLPAGSLTLHTAREKSGKSLQQVDLCCSVALGEPFLDRAVRQGPALYIPAEENLRDVRSRIDSRLDGRRDGMLYVLPVNGFTEDRLRLTEPEHVQALHDVISELQPEVVCLDPFRELHDLSENDSDVMGPLLRPLRQIAHATNTAIVLAHHMSRQGQSRGSTAIRASADQEWAFTRTDDDAASDDAAGAAGRLVIVGRFGPRQKIGVQLGDGLRWKPASLRSVEPTAALRDRIISQLESKDEWFDSDGLGTACGVSRKSIQNVISQMMREQPHPFAYAGSGKSNDPRRYHSLSGELWPDESGAGTGGIRSHDSQPYACGNREPIVATTSNGSGNDGKRFGSRLETVPDSHPPRGGSDGNRFSDEHEEIEIWTA